jgi:hypothetical protein
VSDWGFFSSFVASSHHVPGTFLPPEPDKIVEALRILDCNNLRSLRICLFPNLLNPVGNEVALVDRASDCLAKLLSVITPTMRRVTFVLGYNDMPLEACKLIKWEMLQDIDWDRFPDLELVTIGLMPRHSDRLTEINARDHIRSRMPSLHARGLLHFEAMVRHPVSCFIFSIKQEKPVC